MTVTDFPAPTEANVIVWPTDAERAEFLAVGMDDHTLTRLRTSPASEATFHAAFALRWGADPRKVAAALATHVPGRHRETCPASRCVAHAGDWHQDTYGMSWQA